MVGESCPLFFFDSLCRFSSSLIRLNRSSQYHRAADLFVLFFDSSLFSQHHDSILSRFGNMKCCRNWIYKYLFSPWSFLFVCHVFFLAKIQIKLNTKYIFYFVFCKYKLLSLQQQKRKT